MSLLLCHCSESKVMGVGHLLKVSELLEGSGKLPGWQSIPLGVGGGVAGVCNSITQEVLVLRVLHGLQQQAAHTE